jgi:CubicO group peptidase (beta-lactamase class C family)
MGRLRRERIAISVVSGAIAVGALLVSPVRVLAAFSIGSRVVVATTAQVRAAASSSATLVGTHPPGMLGTITAGPVAADGQTWWNVDYGADSDGWSIEGALANPYFPPAEGSGGWRSLVTRDATPSAAQKADIRAKAALDWDKLKLARDYSQGFAASTVLVVRNGWIAAEWGLATSYQVASVSKSMTGLAMAKVFDLSQTGALTSAIDPESFAYQYLPSSWGAADARRRIIRIKHLLTMSSGLEPHDSPNQPDYVNIVLNQPVRVPPETEWSYASVPLDLLSIAVQRLTGQRLRDFFNQHIAAPLGIPPLTWKMFDIYTGGSSGASITARDLARLGYLMQMNGAWGSGGGQSQVVSAQQAVLLRQWAAFLEPLTFVPTPGSPFSVDPESTDYYGRLWWTNRTGAALGAPVPRDVYYAHGYKETLLFIVPSLNMVVVRFGSRPLNLPEFRRQFMARIMAAVVAPGPEPPSTAQAVTSLTLINADTDQPIGVFDPLSNGVTIDLSTLPTRRLNVRANTSPAVVGSVRFGLDGNPNFRTETGAPYALAGETSGDYAAWTPTVGSHTIQATPYTGAGATGTPGALLAITFNVIDAPGTNDAPVVSAGPDLTVALSGSAPLDGTVTDDGVPSPVTTTWAKVSGPGTVTFGNAAAVDTTAQFSAAGTYVLRLTGNDGALSASDDVTIAVTTAQQAVVSFTLIDTDRDQPVAGFDPLADGATLDLGTLPTRNLNVRANTQPATVGSVRFALDSNANFRTETTPPYALAGDTSGNYAPWTPSTGTHTLTATPFTQAGGGGTAGTALTIRFTVQGN